MSTNPVSRSSTTNSPRVQAFDGLRGIAVLAVIACHLSDYYPRPGILKTILRAGWCGVDLFFVLSGFLITGILLKTRAAPNYFQSFYTRRILRIFPVYYSALIAILIAAYFFPAMNPVLPAPHDRIFYFFYLNNWWALLHDSWHANIIGHFWSLAVEEQFYFVWPFLVWRLSLQKIKAIAICSIILAPIVRIALYATYGDIRDLVENPFCRMDSLLTGALLACLVGQARGLRRTHWSAYHWIAAFTALAIILSSFSDLLVLKIVASPLLIPTGLALIFGALISNTYLNRSSTTPPQQTLRHPALKQLGKYSYAIYIFHVPLLWLLARLILDAKPAATLPQFLLLTCAVLILTLLAAKLSFDHFETYFLNLKSKFAAL